MTLVQFEPTILRLLLVISLHVPFNKIKTLLLSLLLSDFPLFYKHRIYHNFVILL